MNNQIKQMSYYAEHILQTLTAGNVHSVYRRTINLTDGKNILSLQADGSPLSPISLIAGLTDSDMSTIAVKSGDTVLFNKNSIELRSAAQSYRFIYTDALRHNLELTEPLDAKSRLTLSSNIRTALSGAAAGGFALLFNGKEATDNDLSLMLLAARNYILRCNELCTRQNYQEAACTLSRLLGLGTGLTPSGDDFLCGVFAGLLFSGNTKHPFTHHLQSEIAGRLSDTIDISAAFLSCALACQFSLPVNHLYRLPAPEEILTSFGRIGHSSGTDTLCGILWSLGHI